MSLKENQNLCFVPILTLQFSCSLFSLLAREWVSLSIITIHATGVQLYGLDQYQRNHREHTHISRLPVILSQLIRTPFPNPLARKICFCPSFCYSQALYSSLSGLILDQIWEIKHGKNGNIPYGVFVQVLTSIHMLFFKFLS